MHDIFLTINLIKVRACDFHLTLIRLDLFVTENYLKIVMRNVFTKKLIKLRHKIEFLSDVGKTHHQPKTCEQIKHSAWYLGSQLKRLISENNLKFKFQTYHNAQPSCPVKYVFFCIL